MAPMLKLPYQIVLASESPRRKEILSRIVEVFLVVPSHADESALRSENPWQTARQSALVKANSVANRIQDHLVIAGDTLVVLSTPEGYRQLFKPTDRDDAISMLQQLSGKEHLVITGVCLKWPEGLRSFEVTTSVGFRHLSQSEIEDYVQGGEPMDKAGAYAIQGGAAGFVRSINGSITNVIGLPIEQLTEELEKLS